MQFKLFLPYALLPVVFFLPEAIKDWFQNFTIPEKLPFYALAFGMPHIIASILVVSQREYINHFRSTLTPLLIFSVTVPFICYLTGFIYELVCVYAAYTIYHVIAQQCGVALSVARLRPTLDWYAWRAAMVLLLLKPFLIHYAPMSLFGEIVGSAVHAVHLGTNVFLTVLLVTTVSLSARAKGNIQGIAYIGVTSIGIYYSHLLVVESHSVLALLLGRVVHDFTGFLVYTQHESRRSSAGPMSKLYAWVPGVDAGVLNLVFAIAIAYPITWAADVHSAGGMLVIALSLFHYGLEGFVWKGGSPLRRYVTFR